MNSRSKSPIPNILIVEDEAELAEVIARHLEDAEMTAHICGRASEALSYLQSNFANLALLDLKLPDGSGFQLVEDLRKQDIHPPIIFLTGNNAEVAKVKGLEMGDDYVTKPFSFTELIARIRAVLRRSETSQDYNVTKNARLSDEPFVFCGVRVNPVRLEMEFPNGKVVSIGRKELGIMVYFVEHKGDVVSRKNIIHAVWGVHANMRSRSFDQYLVKIRENFSDQGQPLDCLRTVHGVGYVYDQEEETPAAKGKAKPKAKVG